MRSKIFLLILIVFSLSCGDETIDSTVADNITGDFLPNNSNNFWKYLVSSSSEDLPDTDFTASDSLYISESSVNSITLAANDDTLANGRMNMILTSGTLYKTANTLKLEGSLDLSENFAALGLAENFTLTDLSILDLDAPNGSIMYTETGTFSNSVPIQDTQIPITVNFEIRTTKLNFYDSKILDTTNYVNVFEGEITLSVEANAIISLFGFPQTLAFLEPQEILSIRYYYADSIGLVNAQTSQGFTLSDELINFLSIANIPLEIPSTINITSTEILSYYLTN